MNKFEDFLKEKKMKITDFIVSTIYTYDTKIEQLLKETFKAHFNKDIDLSYDGSLSTMFHTGFGASYIGISPKISLSPFSKKINKSN